MRTLCMIMTLTACAAAQVASSERIAWFGTWKEGLAAATASARPILLIAAAPQCHNVPGMW